MHETALEKPLAWKKSQVIFVNPMSDLFHKDVPFEFIEKVFDVMRRAHWHQFQVLTKRAERVAELSLYLEWADNIWMGVSVENEKYKFRIDHLRETGAKIKFLSLEPLIGPAWEVESKKYQLGDCGWRIRSGPKTDPAGGLRIFGVSAGAQKSHFSSSNEAECRRNGQDEMPGKLVRA
jgi:protein gp37